MNHWGKNDGNQEYQDSNDSASTPDNLRYFEDILFLLMECKIFFWRKFLKETIKVLHDRRQGGAGNGLLSCRFAAFHDRPS